VTKSEKKKEPGRYSSKLEKLGNVLVLELGRQQLHGEKNER
jgi:hypothetical protein